MKKKRILGIIIIAIGLFFIGSSIYIKQEVNAGRKQISEAQETVKSGKKLFSINPFTKEIGKSITDVMEGKIKEGSDKADRYEALSFWLMIGGIIFVIGGAVLIYLSKKKR